MEWLERLRAALDEDERIAREALDEHRWHAYNADGAFHMEDPWVGFLDELGTVATGMAEESARHIAWQDPKRILDMVAAHREVLDGYTRALEYRAEVDAADPRSFEDADVRDTTIAAAYATVDALESVLWALAKGYGIEVPEHG